MNELMVGTNQVLNMIKTEFESPRPNNKRILKYLFDFEKNQLSTPEYFEIVGEAFKLNPDFFMKEIYETFMSKLVRMTGVEKRIEMEKYILEKYCLVEGEEILFDCSGNVKQVELIEQQESGKYKMDTMPLTISVHSGHVFLTNYRLIAQGSLKVKGGERTKGFLFWATDLWVFTGKSKRTERKNTLIEAVPLFGYQFPIDNHWGLSKSKLLHVVAYFVNMGKKKAVISIKPTNKSKREEEMTRIFNILRRDVSKVIEVMNELLQTEKSAKFRQRYIWGNLKALWKSEEFLGVPDSELFNIVKETYKLDPDFFITSIYPKMMAWKNVSFLNVRDELFDLLRKEGAIFN